MLGRDAARSAGAGGPLSRSGNSNRSHRIGHMSWSNDNIYEYHIFSMTINNEYHTFPAK